MRRPTLLPVTAVDEARALLADQGHLGVCGAFTPEAIAALHVAVRGDGQRLGKAEQPMEVSVRDYGEGWDFREQLWRQSSWLADWLLEGPPAALVSRLLQRTDVWLLRDQTYFKTPGSEPTPWHQDGSFIPVDGLQSLTLWIPLNPIGPQSSPMHYLDHSHRGCRLQREQRDDLDFEGQLSDWVAAAEPVSLYDAMQPGDVLMHDTWCLHGSPRHQDQIDRLAVVVVYGYGEGVLALDHSLASCGPLLRDQARLLRQANADACFPGLAQGSSLPALSNPFVRVGPLPG